MKRLWNCACLVLLWVGAAGAASALPVTLTLVPSSDLLTAGQTLSVDVVVGGLVDDFEIALESFDLNLSFDTSRLQFTSLTFGSSLGNPGDSGETFLTGPGNPNATSVVVMGLFSLLTGPQLLGLQSAPFVLTTIQFQALAAPGSALLQLINLSGSSLGGLGGVSLSDTELSPPGAISVTLVPDPGAAWLLASAIVLLARRARSARA